MIGCSTNMGGIPHHRKGVLCTYIKRTRCWNGWLVHAALSEIGFGMVHTIVVFMGIFPTSTVGMHNFTLNEVTPYIRDTDPLTASQVGWHKLRWTNFHVAMIIPNAIYSLVNWINSSLTRQVGSGLRILLSWNVQPCLGCNGWDSRDSTRSQFLTNGITKFLPLPTRRKGGPFPHGRST